MKRSGMDLLVFLVMLFCSFFLLAGSGAKSREKKGTLVTGTGEIVTDVARSTEPLEPPCVTLLTRVGNVAFSGLIENDLEHGRQEVRGLRDACADPVHGTATAAFTLEEATVAGRSGGLILEATGFFDGDATSPAGARPRYHFTLRGISGDLKGATGNGQMLGQATTTSAFDTYYAEILLPPATPRRR